MQDPEVRSTEGVTKCLRTLWLRLKVITTVYRQFLRLGIRLEPRPIKRPDPAFVYLIFHYQFQSLNMSRLDSLLIALYCPLKSYA